jgi:benzylsuccinate CoA-transferase BbsE subunit
MAQTQAGAAALAGIRVLDVSTNHAAYAGRLLGDLGAEVVRIEPPDGSPVRTLAPLTRSPNGEAFSFAHAFLDAGKRSVTLDLDSSDGRAHFVELAAESDVVIETPGRSSLAEQDIVFDAIRARNPGLILVSISPFGLAGPRAGHAATDLTVLAAGGLLSLGGYRDSEPLAIQGEQAMLASGIFGAVATLAALYERTQTGKGQWIDVSGQECVAFALEDAVADWSINGRIRRRHGEGAREAGTGVYPCQDGYVSVVAGRLGTAQAFVALTQWVAETDTPGGGELLEPRWRDFKFRQSSEGIARFADIFGTFCSVRSKRELYREGQARQIAIAPVNTIADIVQDPQLAANGYFERQFDPVLQKEMTFPGPPYRLSRTPAHRGGAAPQLGEHNDDILSSKPGYAGRRAEAAFGGRV